MHRQQAMKIVISLENLVGLIIVLAIYLKLGFAWYWLPILFLFFDISALGYLVNKKVGAIGYNIVHSLIGPALLLTLFLIVDVKAMLFISLIWLFHIFLDRALGFGLKHFEGFGHTHLGKIGKASKEPVKR